MNEVMSVKEAAQQLGVTVVHMRKGIEQGVYPFGVAVKGGRGERNKYIIFRRRFEKWLNGELTG